MAKFKYIKAIGLELEMGWFKPRKDLHWDESLLVEDFKEITNIINKNGGLWESHVGEVTSPPLDNIEDINSFIKKNWGDEVTPRCSFHLHVSFSKISTYERCMTRYFYRAFLKAMKGFGEDNHITNEEFWSRLQGKNRYCLAKFQPQTQLKIIKKPNENRYTHLNYCYSMHKTFESRLFPTFKNYRVAQIAAKAFIDFIEGYLEKNPPVELNKRVEILDEEIAPKKIEIPKFNYFELKKKEKLGRNYQPLEYKEDYYNGTVLKEVKIENIF